MTPAPLARVDARAKVTGSVKYAADRVPDGLLYAVLTCASIPRGRVIAVDTSAAEAQPGVLMVLSRLEADEVQSAGYLMAGRFGMTSVQPLSDDRISYRGQPIAVVVGQTLHETVEGARLVAARYESEPAALRLGDEGAETVDQADVLPPGMGDGVDIGDAQRALADADVLVAADYILPPQSPAPMEPIGCVVDWTADRLVVHEGTQNASALRHGLAQQLGIDPDTIDIRSPFLGGGFGNKIALGAHTAWAAVASRRLGRPVKLILTRSQMFLATSARPESHHRIRLGATRAGRIVAATHDVDQQTSRADNYPADYVSYSSRMYGIENFRGHERLVRTDVHTPGFMRAPWEHPASFALETAVDELAYACGLDPVQLRLMNDTATDPVTGRPFSSRHLSECLTRGSQMFDWNKRSPEPGAMRASDGTHIGWGMAAGAYGSPTVAAVTHLRAGPDGRLTVSTGAHEMGQGIRTVITEAVVNDLGIPLECVVLDIGDTRGAPQHITAGSWGTVSVLRGVHEALAALRVRLHLPPAGPVGDLGQRVAASSSTAVHVRAETRGPGQPAEAITRLYQGGLTKQGPVYPEFTSYSYVAHFVEVHLTPLTRQLRVVRTVSVLDCGRVASPVTAASQVRGAVVWGLGAALQEICEVDPRFGGFLNDDLAAYSVPVNADLPSIELSFIGVPDLALSPSGIKSLGEVGMVGLAAAIGNAVFHATGRRHRKLPIRTDDLL